jgi:hypothetical protein
LTELIALIEAFPTMELPDKWALLSRLVDVHVTISMEWGKGWTYRRTRTLDPDIRPEHVDELIWRKDAPAQLGRANPAGFQVLYVSDRQNTSLREARVTSSRVVVAEFAIRDDRSTRVAPIGEFAQIQRTGRGYLSGEVSDAVTGMLNACGREDALSLIITDAFLQECFVNDDSYELSSHIALAVFEKCPSVAAIAYPSRRQLGGLNFAVKVATFWHDWALVGARYGTARHLACGYYRLADAQAADGVYQDGRIRWCDVGEGERILLEPYVPIGEEMPACNTP